MEPADNFSATRVDSVLSFLWMFCPSIDFDGVSNFAPLPKDAK
ncbi:hypothetical protein C4K30_4854 [Pseudomonas chlororaphis subsp. piscium]|nr:hypothetical protein C4K30_4854 [Pseudomonas chlororaphis subsp. piscium]